jgi:integrase
LSARQTAIQGPQFTPQHATAEEYAEFLGDHLRKASSIKTYLHRRKQFVDAYPELADWFSAPLAERIGRLHGERWGTRMKEPKSTELTCRVSYRARPYLAFLALRGYASFDWEWLVGMPRLDVWSLFGGTSLAAGADQLSEEAEKLGYNRVTSIAGVRWVVMRIYMHTLDPNVGSIEEATLDELKKAVRSFEERPDVDLFFGSKKGFRGAAKYRRAYVHLMRVVLYHRGQTDTLPRRGVRGRTEHPSVRPRMEVVAKRYLTARGANSRPSTVENYERSLRHFVGWLAQEHSDLESFAGVTRDHVLEYAAALETDISPSTGRPLSASSRFSRLCDLKVFFRDAASWGWGDVPDRPLLSVGDLPKIPKRVPRYIPEEELPRIMEAVRSLECPYQRAALLVARWSGARADEIRRLEIDCLDSYPDGTPRLRIPAGKTYQERMVPLNQEAAEAIRGLQELRRGEPTRTVRDELTGKPTRYLFVHHGKLYSYNYLFMYASQKVCERAGLSSSDEKPTLSAHRFRHTVGTELAESGARLNTIMKVLGHESANMSMVYAQISDREVLKDYQAILGPGATIAGPLAETLRSGELPHAEVEWIKTKFFKTELELGHCLRLPQEGPCECDLYLNCAKFVTTPEYVPRLRARRLKEFELIEDAASNSWDREVERHRCTVRRIEQLLRELDAPLDAEENVG